MSLLSPPYSAKLTLERDSRISFKSSFSLQGTQGMMEWGAAVYPRPTLVPSLYFSSSSFPPVSISNPCTISVTSQALNCIDILMTPITTSLNPEHLYWEFQFLASNQLQVMSSSYLQNGVLSNGTLHHFWTSGKWDHHSFPPNGKFWQFYCKTYCKSVSFPALNATHLVKKTAVSQLGYFHSAFATLIFAPFNLLSPEKKKK